MTRAGGFRRGDGNGRFARRAGVAILIAWTGVAAFAQDESPRVRTADGLPYLEVEARWGFSVPAPAATGFRLDAAGGVCILRPEIGLERYRLASGMPWVGEVLPGHDDDGALSGLGHFAISALWALELGHDHRYVYRRIDGSDPSGELAELDLAWGRISDLDLRGDRLALLGVPSREHAAPGPDDSVVWLGTLSSGLGDLRKALADPSVRTLASQARLAWAQELGLGVLRFAPDGSLVVYPGHLPMLYRLDADGGLSRAWDLLRLGAIDPRSQLPDPLTGFESAGAAESWMGSAELVDDLAILADGRPALLTRELVGGAPRWTLAVVGERRARRFAVPIRSASPTARARMDVDEQGRILFFVGERAPRRELMAGEEVTVARLPSAQEVGPGRAAIHPWGRLIDLTRTSARLALESPTVPGGGPGASDARVTRLVAPSAAAPGGRSVEGVALEQLIAPAVILDVESQAERNPGYALRIADLDLWEAHNGRIPEGSVVLLRTGADAHRSEPGRESGSGRSGATASAPSPGFGIEAAAVLLRERRVAALGTDGPSLEPGGADEGGVLRLAAAADVPVMIDLTSLERLPATGAWIVALPLPISGATSAPLRAIAFAP